MKPPIIRMKLWKNTQTSPASQPLIGSPVLSVIGSMMTKVTTNMCGTLMPDGSAQTSLRPVFLREPIGEPRVVEVDRHIIRPSAGRMRPNTIESGIFSTKRNRPVSTSMLTRMLVPKPKNAFQSPGVQRAG